MSGFHSVVLCLIYIISVVTGAQTIPSDDEIVEQGLYSKYDNVIILGQRNFYKKVYGQPHAWIIQFYNSFCGHCKAFSPNYKTLASDVVQWKKLIRLAVVDCSVEENNDICREFEVMAYPSLRYIHEDYKKGNANVGDRLFVTETANKLKSQIIYKMQNEQSMGRFQQAHSLNIASYASYTAALSDIPNNVVYTFLIFENQNSTVGSELILDTNDYTNIRIKRVFENSELAEIADIKHFPGLVAVRSTLEPTPLTPKNPTKENLLYAVNTFLKSKKYVFPIIDIGIDFETNNKHITENKHRINTDVVYYSDLEKTLKMSLHTEIVKYKVLKDDVLQALLDYLDMLITSFPFKANGKSYMLNLRNTIAMKQEWNGGDLYDLVKDTENSFAPVYSSDLNYVACKGSQTKYRGYTCGLWILFHTLTVNAALSPGSEGPKALKAIHGYVKYFFGCTDCSNHFQEMAARNKIFEVKENDKAVLWLWVAHNEVNLRLAGDVTEDPEFPKIQFPTLERCPNCRLIRGAWNLSAVYRYLQSIYGKDYIQDYTSAKVAASAPNPLSNVDIGMLSLLYIFSFIILILVIKLFLTKRFYRRRVYKHDGWGKV